MKEYIKRNLFDIQNEHTVQDIKKLPRLVNPVSRRVGLRTYKQHISCNINRKGVLDIDSVKGCAYGMSKYPNGGCYGLCYAAKTAKLYKYDFSVSVSRAIDNKTSDQLPLFEGLFLDGSKTVLNIVHRHNLDWFRIGTMGDPCHDWPLTVDLCQWLGEIKTPVIVTKHWIKIPCDLLPKLRRLGVVFNTSISPLDTERERVYRLAQFNRLKKVGIRSVLRIVSCKFGKTKTGKILNKIQKGLFKNHPVIDNPLRITRTDKRVVNGDIIVEKVKDLNCETFISRYNTDTYIGKCGDCPDQCGVLYK